MSWSRPAVLAWMLEEAWRDLHWVDLDDNLWWEERGGKTPHLIVQKERAWDQDYRFCKRRWDPRRDLHGWNHSQVSGGHPGAINLTHLIERLHPRPLFTEVSVWPTNCWGRVERPSARSSWSWGPSTRMLWELHGGSDQGQSTHPYYYQPFLRFYSCGIPVRPAVFKEELHEEGAHGHWWDFLQNLAQKTQQGKWWWTTECSRPNSVVRWVVLSRLQAFVDCREMLVGKS